MQGWVVICSVGTLRSAAMGLLPRPVAARLRAARLTLLQPTQIDESAIIAAIASTKNHPADSVLVDVGAHFGTVTSQFLDLGWSVVAYEPDPANRKQFERLVGANDRVQLSTAAVSDEPAESIPLFSSPISTGVSTLAAFHESHESAVNVRVVTLAADLHERGIKRVEFLKIDVEGFDYLALKGFDWEAYAPRFVLYEFEDRKTVPLGYSLSDSGLFVAEQGYHLVYSVWEPIVEYGTRHQWRGLFTVPPQDVGDCWGNVLCFRDAADAHRTLRMFGSRRNRFLHALRSG